ncbi:MAG TPA: non-ribosomal peptide synthetase, partial [Anaerolineae bacterium]|nr:non-ribosomal peptide synthetase [Anaerolineae bacterium]
PPTPLDLQSFAHFIEEQKITTLFLASGLFHQIADYYLASLSSLRYLLTGGDIVSVAHIERARSALPNTELICVYGPTENTTYTTYFPVPKTGELGSAMPIGRPIANTKVYILDQQLRPMGIGQVGELYVSGMGLARGYLNRPNLTADRFVENPFLHNGSKMYATGDLACYRPDGVIEFHGRKDTQIKLRGFRIEMGEIDHALGQHPAIGDHFVMPRVDENGDKVLIAYLVATQTPPTRSELENHLQQWLPSYMIPRHFVWLDRLPLNHNGKVDRNVLPLPDPARPDLETQFVAPRTTLEQQIAAIWCEILSLDSIGIYDDFFVLGGHSLSATQVIERIRIQFGIDFPLYHLFEKRTIAGLAQLLETPQNYAVTTIPPLTVQARKAPLPLSFVQERLWFLAQLHPHDPSYNVPLFYQLAGQFDLACLAQSLTRLIQRHESLHTLFVEQAGVAQQLIVPDMPLVLNVVTCEADQVQALISAEIQRPFDLATGPLFRTTLLQVNQQPHILIFNMHHIISDGWSINIFTTEFAAIYTALSQEQSPALPPLPFQYRDYAIWQRNWLQGARLSKQLTYWQTHLAGYSGILDLPTDYPRPPAQTFLGDTYQKLLPETLTAQLDTLGQAHAATPFMTLLATFNILLWHYSGQADIVVGSPIANRL